ncbi:MAG: hypothetical protein AABZ12_06750 [Planctomycetota bacterium]
MIRNRNKAMLDWRSRSVRAIGAIAALGAAWCLGFGHPCSAQDETKEKPKPSQTTPADELSRRLIRKAVNDSDEGIMDNVIRLMNESAKRVGVQFDAGEKTQKVQTQAVEKLDEAIKAAAMQRRPSRQPSKSVSADRRRMQPPPKSAKKDDAAPSDRAARLKPSDSVESLGPPLGETDEKREGGTMRELRRGWGHLPARDREEVIQGSGENCLERYRAWVERYYRALQEADER